MRIVHVTDIHVGRPPSVGELFNKRLAGAVNLYVLGRHHHFTPAAQAALVSAASAIEADLVLCTGDLTATGIIGGWVVGVLMIGVDAGSFWSQIQGGVDVWKDVGNGLIKSVVFGFTVTFVALLQGFQAQATPEGVSKATTRTVVMASLAVLGLDFILTAMMFSL